MIMKMTLYLWLWPCIILLRSSSAKPLPNLQSVWSKTEPMHTARSGHTASVLMNGQVLAVGGCNDRSLKSVEAFDPTNETWNVVANMNIARSYHTASVLTDGRVLVAGGANGTNFQGGASSCSLPLDITMMTVRKNKIRDSKQSLATLKMNAIMSDADSSAELYDLISGHWQVTGRMNDERVFHTASVLKNGQVLVTGGANNFVVLDSAELYDPTTGHWTRTSSMNTNRFLHTASVLEDGRVLVIGGEGVDAFVTAEIYDPVSETWTLVNMMNNPRILYAQTLLTDGKLLVSGGEVDEDDSLDIAEIFDSSANTWSVVASMKVGRRLHTASVLVHGKVLVTGGSQTVGSISLNSSELYDPATQTWTLDASLNGPRTLHTASVLPNGKILVAGGYGDDNILLNSAELYSFATDPCVNPRNCQFLGHQLSNDNVAF